MQPLINGEAYSWSQITVNILNTPIAGISAISYSDNQEMQNNYGAGNYPVTQGVGKIEFEGSMTLHKEELEALQSAVSTGRLQDIPAFDVVISFIPIGGQNIKTHTLKFCKFKNNGRELSQGDMMFEQQIDLLIGNILWR